MATDSPIIQPKQSPAAPDLFEQPGRKKVSHSLFSDAVYRFSRNRLAIFGMILVILIFLMAIFADDWFVAMWTGRKPLPLLAHTAYDKQFYGAAGQFPSAKYWFGTDLVGRDFYSRVIYGARTSLAVGILGQLLAVSIGIPLGAIAGWRSGRTDFFIMRLVDIMSALPTLLFAYMIMARIGAGFWNVMLAIGITSWITVCRLTRAQFLSLREKEFVESARMIGAREWRIILRHMLPNALGPIIVAMTLGIPATIFAEASLSFLGVGINPPTPSWGQMLGRDGMANINYFWHLSLFPALMIGLTMLGFTLMGDGLRDALDPASQGKR